MGDTHLIKSTPYLMVVHKCIFKIRDGLQEAKTSFSFGQKQYLAGIRNCAENEKTENETGPKLKKSAVSALKTKFGWSLAAGGSFCPLPRHCTLLQDFAS